MTDQVKILQVTKVKGEDCHYVVAISIGSIYVFPAVRVRYKPPHIQVSFYKVAVELGDGKKRWAGAVVITDQLEWELIKLRVGRELDRYLESERLRHQRGEPETPGYTVYEVPDHA